MNNSKFKGKMNKEKTKLDYKGRKMKKKNSINFKGRRKKDKEFYNWRKNTDQLHHQMDYFVNTIFILQ